MMEPVVIALICSASFGVVVAITFFIRQLLLSRDKNLNDIAQRKAIAQEAAELKKIRDEMKENTRSVAHYNVLVDNKDSIMYLDAEIDKKIGEKSNIVERCVQFILKELGAIVDGAISVERKDAYDRLKLEVDQQIEFYNGEIKQLQNRRKALWNTHTDLQESLIKQEKDRNDSLDMIYLKHSGYFYKLCLQHNKNAENIGTQSIQSGTSTFKAMILAPIHYLMQFFTQSSGISIVRAQTEQQERQDVQQTQQDVSDSDQDEDLQRDQDKSTDKEDDEELTQRMFV